MISGLNIKKKIFENYNYLYKSFLPEKNFNTSYIKEINAQVYKDKDYSLIQIIAERQLAL